MVLNRVIRSKKGFNNNIVKGAENERQKISKNEKLILKGVNVHQSI